MFCFKFYVICLLTGLSLAYARGLVTEDLETILALHVDRSAGAAMIANCKYFAIEYIISAYEYITVTASLRKWIL
jgi:hypothetical protein